MSQAALQRPVALAVLSPHDLLDVAEAEFERDRPTALRDEPLPAAQAAPVGDLSAVALPQELGALSSLLAQWALDLASRTEELNSDSLRPVHMALMAQAGGQPVRYAQVAYKAQLLPLLGDAQAQSLPGATGELARQPWRVQWHNEITALEHPSITRLSSGQRSTPAPMPAHKAVHEAHVAAEVIASELQGNKELAEKLKSSAFNARVIPSVAYTDPEVAWVGLTEDQAKAQGIKVKKGLFPWTASGRAIANGRDEGVTKLLFDDSPEAHGHGKIVGGGMVGTHAGDMVGEIALAIEMGADAVDIGKTIHPHPTLGESIGMAAEIAHGSCTDVPPARK